MFVRDGRDCPSGFRVPRGSLLVATMPLAVGNDPEDHKQDVQGRSHHDQGGVVYLSGFIWRDLRSDCKPAFKDIAGRQRQRCIRRQETPSLETVWRGVPILVLVLGFISII